MKHIKLRDSGIVYGNPKPHLKSCHAYFPTIVELSENEIIVGLDIGSAFEALDVRSFSCRSQDGGITWSEPQMIFSPDESEHRVSTTCRLSRINGNKIIGWGCLFDRTREHDGLTNPNTEGFCRTRFVTVESSDGGRSWTPPRPVELPTNWHHFETCTPPYSLNEEGRLLVVTSPWPNWEGELSPWNRDGIAFVSENDGADWTDIVRVFPNEDRPLLALEPAIARLANGHILAVCWTFDNLQQRSVHNRWCLSMDGGKQFEPPKTAPIHGETCRPLVLPNNRVLFVYRRVDRPGLWAHLALIQNGDWQPIEDFQLWSGVLNNQPSEGHGKVEKMSTMKFGSPAIIQRKNGEIFIVFWCVEDCVSVIRWIRLEVHQ